MGFRDSKDFVDGVDDTVCGVLVQFQNIRSVVSLLDNVDVLLVLHGRGVDGRSREGVVGVPDQAQGVDGPLHQVLVDNLSSFFPIAFPANLSKAASTGANKVNGPPVSTVSIRPAASTAILSAENRGSSFRLSAMVYSTGG